MGQNDDLNAAVAHVVLCCVAGQRIGSYNRRNFTQPGMHANFLIHGALGALHYQSGRLNNDFTQAYIVSTFATRCLALPCLLADLYSGNRNISTIYLISGIIPFVMAMSGNENEGLVNLIIAVDIVSLCIYAQNRDRMWGWYAAGAGALAYFFTPQNGKQVAYPLFLALFEYCASNISI